MNLVKQSDFDNYLAGLLVPSKFRGAFFAIRAYNVELASMKDQTHGNAVAGRMRFQWWRDVIEGIYNGRGAHGGEQQYLQQPVAYALAYYSQEHGLTRHWLERSLDARQRDVTQESHESLDDIETYAEQGHSSILYLLLESMNIRDDQSNYLASHVGVCSGLVTLLRAFPYHVSKRQLYLPRSMLRERSLTVGQLLSGPPLTAETQTALQDCVFEVACQAHGHLDKARTLAATTTKHDAFHVCGGPALRSAMFLKLLQEKNFNPNHPDLIKSVQFEYQLKLLRARLFRSF